MRIGERCVIQKAIIDSGSVVPDGLQIGVDREADAERFYVTEGGVTLVTPTMLRALTRGAGSFPAACPRDPLERLNGWLLRSCVPVASSSPRCCSPVAPRSPRTSSPRRVVLNVQMLSTDMFAQKFRVRVKVENPNDVELKVKGIEFEFLLMGDGFAEGNSSDQFVLPAKGEAEFDMTVSTNFVSSLGRLISRRAAASSRT